MPPCLVHHPTEQTHARRIPARAQAQARAQARATRIPGEPRRASAAFLASLIRPSILLKIQPRSCSIRSSIFSCSSTCDTLPSIPPLPSLPQLAPRLFLFLNLVVGEVKLLHIAHQTKHLSQESAPGKSQGMGTRQQGAISPSSGPGPHWHT